MMSAVIQYIFQAVKNFTQFGISFITSSAKLAGYRTLSTLDFIKNTLYAGVSTIQLLMTNFATGITSTLSSITTRTLRSILEIGRFVQNMAHQTTQFITRIMAWALFKILAGITNIFDGICTIFSLITRSFICFFKTLLSIPKYIFSSVLSTYTTLNNLISNLFLALIEREWALVTKLHRAISATFDIIKITAIFIVLSISSAATFIAWDIPSKIINIIKSLMNSISNAAISIFLGVSPKLQTAHSLTKSALKGTAGFIFLDIPKGFLTGASYFFYSIADGIFFIGSTLWIIPSLVITKLQIVSSVALNLASGLTRSLFLDLPSNLFCSIKILGHATGSIASSTYNVLRNIFGSTFNFIFFEIPQFLWNTSASAANILGATLWSILSFLGSTALKIYQFTKNGLEVGAIFIFLDIPRTLFAGFMFVTRLFGSGILNTYNILKIATFHTFNFIFLRVPRIFFETITSLGTMIASGLYGAHAVATPKLLAVHSVSKKAVSATAGFILLEIPKSLFYYLKITAATSQNGLIEVYYGLKAALLWSGQFIFLQIPRAFFYCLKATGIFLLNCLTITIRQIQKTIHWSALGVIAFLAGANKASHLIGRTSRILLEGIIGIPRKIAAGFVNAAWMLYVIFQSIGNAIRAIWDGICYLAAAPLLAVRHLIDLMIAHAHRTHDAIIATIYAQRPAIQTYTFLGTGIYLLLVLFATYNAHHNRPISNIGTTKQHSHSHAIPVTVDLEIHKLERSKDGFGSIDIEGILTNSYNTGTEPARSVDDFTITNAKHFTLKKLSSTVNHAHVTNTRHLLTATLEPAESNAPTFPFSGSQSSFVIQNHSLSAREIHYQAANRLLSESGSTVLGLQKILMEPGENKTHARSESALMPELTVTLEYQRWQPYVVIGLYILLFAIMLASIASLLIPAQSIRLTVSGISFCLLGMTWVGSYLAGMLTNINHLMITLILGLALSAIIIALNGSTSNFSQESLNKLHYENGQREGQTRWIVLLLSTLALLLTVLIKL